ncbi:MAG: hypothetical protein KKH41_08900 [Candidatus Thermoplasmatota archaeon]|nr:hypothetical protein [Euryarchaeota archaeon]MBU4031597.1 hypothetical protein [Candidatus Thermoplasmatota archaeon]MBU4070558.1 hypothetical protein [Candidatus Thermoplasmatota archaeon]MBU4144704.1 hypothetical protein [Candidatus Thermoplasmatota archaeon]MBU4592683.1 hypothetical protein [Candidatus Thermoplasmatota archaeon]
MHGMKRERILRVLLNDSDGSLTKYKLAKFSATSKSWIIDYLRTLENGKLVKGTKVLNKEKLLDYWFSITQTPKHYDFFVQSPKEFLQNIGMDYALTTYAAENLLNHYLFPSRTDLYIKEGDLALWKEKISGSGGLVGKGNLRLLVYDDHTLYEKKKIKGMWVASVSQVLIDLKREGGVCLEAYEMMVKNID